MKRFISALWVVFVFCALPAAVFGAGGSAPASGTPQGEAQAPQTAAPSGESAQAAPQETVIQNPVVAQVQLTELEPVYLKQLQSEVALLEKQAGSSMPAEQRAQVLDMMINQRLVLQAAARDRILVSEGELDQQIQQMREGLRQTVGRLPDDAEFESLIKAETGLDMKTYRDQLRRQLVMQKYLMAKKRNIIESIKEPTDKEIVEFFNNNRERFVRNEGVRLGIIHIPPNSEALANRLSQEIGTSAARFDQKVEEARSPNAGYQARIGFFERNQQNRQMYGQTLVDTIFSLEQGKVSKMVKTEQGFFILKVTNNYPFKALGLDDEVQPESGRLVRSYIRAGLLQENQIAAAARAEGELVAELRAVSPEPFKVFKEHLNW